MKKTLARGAALAFLSAAALAPMAPAAHAASVFPARATMAAAPFEEGGHGHRCRGREEGEEGFGDEEEFGEEGFEGHFGRHHHGRFEGFEGRRHHHHCCCERREREEDEDFYRRGWYGGGLLYGLLGIL